MSLGRSKPRNNCGHCGKPITSKRWIRAIVDIRARGTFGFKTIGAFLASPYDNVDCFKAEMMKFLEDDFTPMFEVLEASQKGKKEK